MTDQQSDHDFVDRYVDGEPEAVAQIDAWIRSASWSFRRRLSAQWDDLQQDLRLEIFRLLKGGKFRRESNLKTYVWRVVNHTCLDQIRAQNRWRWTPLDDDERVFDIGHRRAGGADVPLETADLLLRVLEEISEECKRLWRLVIEGHSYREMSRELGASEGALRVRALRCREKALAVRERLLGGEEPAGPEA